MSYKSWAPTSSSASSYGHQHQQWTASMGSPAPTPGAPHMNTVSLPHPNSAPRHASAHTHDPHSPFGAPRILALNPFLSYSGRPPLYFNVSQDVQYIRLSPGCSPNVLHDQALNHPVPQLHIRFHQFPSWSIEVMNPRGITVYDVLVKIREAVNRSISPQEIAANPAAPDYFRARTSADPREYAQGVKRIDLLGQHVFFAGLSPSRESSNCWHAHFCANV